MLKDHGAFMMIFIGLSILTATTAVSASAEAGGSGDLLYVCNGGAGNISIVDLNTNAEVASIDRPSMPSGTALSPDGSRLYVSSGYFVDGNVTAIDTGNYTVAGTVMTGYSHGSMAVLPR